MKDPNENEEEVDEFSLDEEKFSNIKLRQESDFFKDESYVPYDLINVKYISKGNKEHWEILKNNKLFIDMPATRFSKKEREFLKTPNGMSFLMNGARAGWKSISQFKKQIKVK